MFVQVYFIHMMYHICLAMYSHYVFQSKSLYQTLPLMVCLDELQERSAREGKIGHLSIVPRELNAIRIIYSSL